MTRMYWTVFGRSPDPEGLKGWVESLLNGHFVLIQIAQAFVASAEFRAIHGADPTPGEFVAAALRNALGREPDPADYRKWVDFLTEHGNGTPARAAAALGIMNSIAILDDPAAAAATLSAIPPRISGGGATGARRPEEGPEPCGRAVPFNRGGSAPAGPRPPGT